MILLGVEAFADQIPPALLLHGGVMPRGDKRTVQSIRRLDKTAELYGGVTEQTGVGGRPPLVHFGKGGHHQPLEIAGHIL